MYAIYGNIYIHLPSYPSFVSIFLQLTWILWGLNQVKSPPQRQLKSPEVGRGPRPSWPFRSPAPTCRGSPRSSCCIKGANPHGHPRKRSEVGEWCSRL